ncbi:MAG: hypothetical protein JSS81_06880 [Acidobacteria bacterium]|nr:hypothetical protein [Acidobacteriota bacterium]
MKSKLFFTGGLALAFVLFFVVTGAQTENGCRPDRQSVNRISEKDFPRLVDFSGEGGDEIAVSGEVWQPFGPYRTIRVEAGQKIVGFGSAVFGTRKGTARVAVGLCYIPSGGSTPTAFENDAHLIADVDALRRPFAVSASGTLPPGTYAVGYCVINRGPQTLDNNDYVNGWMMVVD